MVTQKLLDSIVGVVAVVAMLPVALMEGRRGYNALMYCFFDYFQA